MLAFTVNIINAQKIAVDYDFDLETSKVMFEVLGIKYLIQLRRQIFICLQMF